MKLRAVLLLLSLLAILSVTAGGWIYYSSLKKSAWQEAENQSVDHSEKIKNFISSTLTHNQKAVKALAGLTEIQKALANPDAATVTGANNLFDHLTESFQVDVSYLMDQKGNTIASSNRNDTNSFVGHNYSFRPYFKEAILGNPSVYMAIGVTSQKRGVYFSYPVYADKGKNPVGVAVVKTGVETIEKELIGIGNSQGMITVLAGPHGIVFMSDHNKLLFRLLWKTADEKIAEIAKSEQFGKGPWEWAGFERKGKNQAVDQAGNEYLMFQKSIESLPGWNVVHLNNIKMNSGIIAAPFIGIVSYVLLALCVLIGLAVFILYSMGKSDIVRRMEAEEALRFTLIELKQNEDVLKKSKALLDNTGRMARVGGWELDADTMDVTWTDETYRIHEIPLDHKPPLQEAINFFHPEDRPKLEQAIQRALDHGEPYDMEIRFITAKGKHLWTRTKCDPEMVDGKVVMLKGTFQDITERKRAEDELRRNEKDLRESQRIAHVGSWRLDVATNQVVWTEELYNLYGFDPSLPPPPYTEHMKLFTPESWERLSTALAHTRETGIPYTLELETVRKDGSNGWMWVKGEADVDSAGKTVELWGAVQDISERKRVEETLRKSEERFLLAMKASNDGLFDWNLETNDIYYSPGWKKMLGYEDYELPNDFSVWEKTTDPEDVKKSWELQKKLITKQIDRFVMEFKMRHKDGHWIDILSRAEAIFNDSGKAIRIVGTHTDITERKWAEARIAESEARFKALHNASFGGIAIHDKGVILDCNKGMSELTGYSFEELTGMDGLLLIAPQSRNDVMANIVAGYEKPYEAIGIRKNGEEYSLRMEARNVPYKGKMVRTVEFRDITDLKQAEAEREKLQTQLAQAQKMESVGRLAGGVAHDFNNMLSVIIGNVELVMETMAPDDPHHDNLNEIFSASRRSADVTRQLLAFARKQTIAPEVLDLNRTIESMLKMLRRLIGENIDLAWLPGANVWPVRMDPSQIDQILANLCVNARDAIADVGKITIETGTANFDSAYCADHPGSVAGDFVLLAVSDDGNGMDKGTLANLFEPFFTTKELGKGTGLGLATIFGIVKQNNGFINVYSEPGQGSTFKIYLPRNPAKTESLEKKTSDKINLVGTETILLVEDEPSILKMTRMMLERMGYKVLVAGTPGEAIALAHEHAGEIHLLMTDVVMPEMNGRDLARTLLSLYPNLKRLFMSGYTANVIAHHGVLDEGVQFIQKPFGKQNLAIKVREALDEAK